MIEGFVVVGMTATIGTLILVQNVRRQAAVDEDIWKAAAKKLDGACVLPSALEKAFSLGARVLSTSEEGTEVKVVGTYGKHAKTRAVAAFSGAKDLVISVIAENVVTTLGKKVGVINDEETGDRAFDARFVVTSSDATLCRTWLDVELRTMMLAPLLERWELSLENGKIELEREGAPEERNELVLAVRLVGALAARAAALRAEWEAVADALGGALADGNHAPPFVPIHVRRGEVALVVAVVHGAAGSTTCIRAEKNEPDAEPVALELGRLTLDAEVVNAALTLVAEQLGAAPTPYRH